VIESRELFGLAMVALQAGLAIPLIARMVRSSDRGGTSLAGECIWVVAGVGWLVYSVGIGSVAILISSFLAVGTSLTLALLVWPSAPAQRRTAVILTALTAAFLGSGFALGGLDGLSLTLAIFGTVQFIPQMLESFGKLRARESTAGVSILGSASRMLYTLGWAFYAGAWFVWGDQMTRIDWPIVTWGITGTLAFGLQAYVAARGRRVLTRSA
jgi:hypothetical protein